MKENLSGKSLIKTRNRGYTSCVAVVIGLSAAAKSLQYFVSRGSFKAI